MSSLLAFEDVRAFYGGALIVDGLSFEVTEGECFSLLGPNGVGKTTTLNAIYGIARVRAGRISVEGHVLSGTHRHEASRYGVALVPQGRWIIANLTVEENLVLGAASRRQGRWNLASVFDLFPDLSERRAAAGTALSGGQQQMLAIGRALMANPRILLLDEPSEGLAPVVIDRLGDILARLREDGTSMLLIEQRLDLVLRLADRFAVMAKGRIVSEGRTQQTTPERLRTLVAV